MRARTRLQALAGAAVLVVAGVWASGVFHQRERGKPRGAPAPLLAAVASVEAGRRTTPLIEATANGEFKVTFLARSSQGQAPRIVSDATGWGEGPDESFSFSAGTMTRIGERDWYSLEAHVAPRSRIEYLVAYAPGDYRVDPHNPRQAALRGGGPASEFVTPGYVPPPKLDELPAELAGRTAGATLHSRALSGPVDVIVYTPPGFRGDGNHPVAVFHDRLQWGRDGEGPRVIDRLIARAEIEPIVTVFAGSGRPESEVGAGAIRTFLTGELLAWLSARYAVTGEADRRAILGVSYGAKDALEAASGPSAAYHRVGLLIPGRRLRPADIETLAAQPTNHLQVAILAGLYDAPNLETARRLREAFTAAGHAVHYLEVPEGHNAATWRNHAGEILAPLFPPR